MGLPKELENLLFYFKKIARDTEEFFDYTDERLVTARSLFLIDKEAWDLTNMSILDEIERLREEIVQSE
ncbi:hypothetical protein OROMI_021113 [Orobanche minor]